VEKYGRVEYATDDNIIQHIHIACWTTKVSDTHSEYVILIAFPLLQWLCKCTSHLEEEAFRMTMCLVFQHYNHLTTFYGLLLNIFFHGTPQQCTVEFPAVGKNVVVSHFCDMGITAVPLNL
jgi:hypothetical protein